MTERFAGGALLTLLLAWAPQTACAQTLLKVVDDVIAITAKGGSKKEKARAHQHLAGAGESAMPAGPGADYPRLGERSYAPTRSVISAAAGEPGQVFPGASAPHIVAQSSRRREAAPIYGPLELPSQEDEGPPNGLTLDAAIDRLVQTNYELRTKFQEIPKAQADILSAGLRLNPFLFASTDGIPYNSYSPQRPGAVNYEATIAQPVDLNQKRKIRVRMARQARHVLEAQYQDAVREKIDQLYTAYIDVLEAREGLRAARTGMVNLEEVVEVTRTLAQKGQAPKTELNRAKLQKYNAQTALSAAELALAQATRDLATMLAIPPQYADSLVLRGTLHDPLDAVPDLNEMIPLALRVRPDLAAYRLGVGRARTSLELAKAERFDDVFLFYTPFNIANNAPTGGQNATSWGLGTLLPLPLHNRNQGNISRAQTNVAQTRIELAGAERQIANEVQKAAAEYAATRNVVKRYDMEILATARELRDEKHRLFTRGEEGLSAYLEAQKEYNEVVRQYLETLVRHRRNMLRLNTAVGQRITP
ncbi:MAG TPA: TolC family protein [Pirellulales bacterium]|nr:TolC family protein [Pirellulales bacterium]